MVGITEIESLDRSITLAINGFHNPQMDAVWNFMSAVKVWFPLYLLIAVLMFNRLGWKKALTYVLACALCVLCVDQGAYFVKEAVGRPRPCHDTDMILGGLYLPDPGQILSGPFGFFSAHAGNAMSFAVCSGFAFRGVRHSTPYSVLIVLWAFLVGISRVFKGAHYLGDVVVGWVAGLAVGLFFAWIASRICRLIWKLK